MNFYRLCLKTSENEIQAKSVRDLVKTRFEKPEEIAISQYPDLDEYRLTRICMDQMGYVCIDYLGTVKIVELVE